jgi:hypothetical protein
MKGTRNAFAAIVGRPLVTVVLLGLCSGGASCARTLARPAIAPAASAVDAVLVLPGFGYGRAGERALRALAPALAADGFELFVPAYVARGGLDDSREQLSRFLREQRLHRYRRVHVFAFLAGGWTVNPLLEAGALPNLATIIYDRSPLQERAPRIAADTLHLLTWIRYGSPVFDLARTPYPPLTRANARVALLVETKPTAFLMKHADVARRYGPLNFECDSFSQRYDDCAYLPFTHDEIYRRFAELWPEMKSFIQSGQLTATATRTPPVGDPLALRTHGAK